MVKRREGERRRTAFRRRCSAMGQMVDNRIAAHLHLAEGYVSRAFCIKPSEFYSKTRGRRHVAEARQLVMYLAHVEFGLPLREVGLRYDRDRTTASHACRATEDRRDDPGFDDIVRDIEALISLRNDPLFRPAAGERQ
ncbi:hypothetical protein GCM10011316_23490 [Roseibium aquae]|uniref:Chromosomal replication initiator DnaA C-terminal domain-containing protein n=1 Tax=Roseibium aquae TaxID=1323746 RepID=A0A916TMX4_9HYPH|nr:helix-turn-helix domain-containing protein [Roseibium aquae]GGB50657.1 hypothetical protein GCM10011316_23490 [Roseibium aquae]